MENDGGGNCGHNDKDADLLYFFCCKIYLLYILQLVKNTS